MTATGGAEAGAAEVGFRVRVRYTEPMVRKAVRVFVFRAIRRSAWLWAIAGTLLVSGMVFAQQLGPGFGTGFAVSAVLFC